MDAQLLEERLQADAEIFIVPVDGVQSTGLRPSAVGLQMSARMGART